MVDIIVYDNSFDAKGIIDTETSLIWERRFYEAGYFELHVPASDNSNELLKQGNFIMRADAYESGIILYLKKSASKDGTTDITAIGRFLSYILHGHIIKGMGSVSGNAETVMRDLVERVVMQGAAHDKIDNLYLGETCGTEKTITGINVARKDLHDALREISEASGVGFRVILDPNSGYMYFECVDSHDYSANQSVNPRVIFSEQYDTIIGNVSVTEDDSSTVNAVYVLYTGKYGYGTTAEYITDGAEGTKLREIALETSKGGSEFMDVTEAELIEQAKALIKQKKLNVEASAAYTGSFRYKTDYDIGDIVTVAYKPFGVEINRRIHKITENYSESGKEIIPTFGELFPGREEDT